MSFSVLLLFLPVAACLFWMLLNIFAARRTSTFWNMQFLLLNLVLYFISDACYASPGTTPDILVYSSIIAQFSAPCVIPLLWLYFDRLRFRRPLRPAQLLWLAFPIILVTATSVLTVICGKENIALFMSDVYAEGPHASDPYKGTLYDAYYRWTAVYFRVVLVLELLVALVYFVIYVIKHNVRLKHLWAFHRKGEPIRILELQLFNLMIPALVMLGKMVLLRSFLLEHVWISVVLALVVTLTMFAFCFTSHMGEKEKITKVQAKHIMFFNYNPAIKGPIVEIMMEELLEEAEQDALLRFQEKIGETLDMEKMTPREISAVKEQLFSSVAGSWDDSLLSRFQTLMLNDQLFLKPSLSLADVAERLHTNKTYVSKLVNNAYNLGFPELLNTLRIDYAEQYLLNHRDAKQEEVARACGFLSASSFNNIFKKTTGVTPKMWLARAENKRGSVLNNE